MFVRFFLILLALCSACPGGTIDPVVSDEKYVSYGGLHECVVPIYGNCECGMEGGKPHKFAASAVVVGRKWVVTAAHVVAKSSGVKVRVRGKEHAMRRVIVNSGFKQETMGRYDIAMCESEEDMHLDFYPALYEGDGESGKVASICGYGITGTFSTGAVRGDGKKRAGSNTIDRAENHVLFCSVVGGKKTEMEFLIAPGDSGGGMFIDQKLAGINSFVSASDGKSNSDYGDECAFTRVSLFAPWMRACMNGEERTSLIDDGVDVVLNPERGAPSE